MKVRCAIRPFTSATSTALYFALLHNADTLNLTLALSVDTGHKLCAAEPSGWTNMWNTVGYIVSSCSSRKYSNVRHLETEECEVALGEYLR